MVCLQQLEALTEIRRKLDRRGLMFRCKPPLLPLTGSQTQAEILCEVFSEQEGQCPLYLILAASAPCASIQ